MLRYALLLLALSIATPVAARPLVEMEVLDREDGGERLQPIHHRGQHWIGGTPGHRYSVRVTNTSGERVLVVLSVDGINAVTGEVAAPWQNGYVLAPWQTSEIAGWRKSHEEVAQFVFTSLADSYAARTGRPDHVGVIGIAVFEEAQVHRQHDHAVAASPPPLVAREEGHAAAAAKSQQSSRERQSLARDEASQQVGTGHGMREWAPAASTTFVRASRQPAQITQLRYDAHTALVARGIMPHSTGPEAFPIRFVADPPGW